MVITIAVMIALVEWTGPARAQTATVELRNGQGAVVGHARLSQESGGVRLQVEVSGLTPGLHGFHDDRQGGRAIGPRHGQQARA